jgi:hypothetical protein
VAVEAGPHVGDRALAAVALEALEPPAAGRAEAGRVLSITPTTLRGPSAIAFPSPFASRRSKTNTAPFGYSPLPCRSARRALSFAYTWWMPPNASYSG